MRCDSRVVMKKSWRLVNFTFLFSQKIFASIWMHQTLAYILLAEVPGAARVNLQPAEHFLLCKQLLEFEAPRPICGRGGGQTCTKTYLGQVGMCVQNFIKIGSGIWIFINPPLTNRQIDICTPIFMVCCFHCSTV